MVYIYIPVWYTFVCRNHIIYFIYIFYFIYLFKCFSLILFATVDLENKDLFKYANEHRATTKLVVSCPKISDSCCLLQFVEMLDHVAFHVITAHRSAHCTISIQIHYVVTAAAWHWLLIKSWPRRNIQSRWYERSKKLIDSFRYISKYIRNLFKLRTLLKTAESRVIKTVEEYTIYNSLDRFDRL